MALTRLALVSVLLCRAAALHIYQPYRVNADNDGLAQLACSFNHTGRGQELRVTLLRGLSGKDVVCMSSFQLPNTSLESDEPLSCQGNASANRLDLTVPGLSGADTDFYRCKVEILYPPPYRLGLGSGTLIYVSERPPCPAKEHSMDWVFMAVPVTVVVCTVIIIISILVYRTLNRRVNSEYVDTAPVIPEKMKTNSRYVLF
ncbi:cytotoxic T-lymphocyte protein 4 [Erpetoichthys calabaricus]|uniref:cytotoxic T-lymphocyte protein 4 n=1 Tax=Erpetoichthys calabaricus TaxID=27687 RepID=UPI00109FDF98|nr:cytotoxic T-lymphocyte protein 4 [Erpetoichthys calabaricus]